MTFQLRTLVTGLVCSLTLFMQTDERESQPTPAEMELVVAHLPRPAVDPLALGKFIELKDKLTKLSEDRDDTVLESVVTELARITDKWLTGQWGLKIRAPIPSPPRIEYATSWLDEQGRPVIGLYPIQVYSEANARLDEQQMYFGQFHSPELERAIRSSMEESIDRAWVVLVIREAYRIDSGQVTREEYRWRSYAQESEAWEYMVLEGIMPLRTAGLFNYPILPCFQTALMAHDLDDNYPDSRTWEKFVTARLGPSGQISPKLWGEMWSEWVKLPRTKP